MKRIGGKRRGTRYKLQRSPRTRGKIRLTAYFQKFQEDDRVALLIDPSMAQGMFHPRFHGKTGRVTGSQGGSYLVEITDRTKKKTLIVHPVHLKRIKWAILPF